MYTVCASVRVMHVCVDNVRIILVDLGWESLEGGKVFRRSAGKAAVRVGIRIRMDWGKRGKKWGEGGGKRYFEKGGW